MGFWGSSDKGTIPQMMESFRQQIEYLYMNGSRTALLATPVTAKPEST